MPLDSRHRQLAEHQSAAAYAEMKRFFPRHESRRDRRGARSARCFRQFIGARRLGIRLSCPQPIRIGRTTEAEDKKANLTVVHLGA